MLIFPLYGDDDAFIQQYSPCFIQMSTRNKSIYIQIKHALRFLVLTVGLIVILYYKKITVIGLSENFKYTDLENNYNEI